MPIEFYYAPISPACRPVWMALEQLGVQYDEKPINVFEGGTRTEEFKEVNVHQKIPAIKEGDFSMGESRAIAAYICGKYEDKKTKESLYPTDPRIKAMVDCRIYRDITDLTNVSKYLNISGVFQGEKDLCKEHEDTVTEYCKNMEAILMKNKFVAADHLTIADFFAYVTIGFVKMSEDFQDMSAYPKIEAWVKTMSELPYHKKTCEEPMAQLAGMYKAKRGLE